MAKAGDEYQEIVGLVRQALEPNAFVKTGQWITGPDGKRDMDVEVRGMLQGEEHFILVECKDWSRKVGIGPIDALESKRRDLGADDAVIYSNSGFTEPAIRKAKRVGIRMFSAMRKGDDKIKFILHRQVVALASSVNTYSIRIGSGSNEIDSPEGWTPKDIEYQGLPLLNFLKRESLKVLEDLKEPGTFTISYKFNQIIEFHIKGIPVEVDRLQLIVSCERKYVTQVIQENVTLGHYDFLSDTVTIPNKQSLIIGGVDNTKWEDVDLNKFIIEKRDFERQTMKMSLHLFKPIVGIDGVETPGISDLVLGQDIKFEARKC